ncbi:C1 family peptidase [Bradyrhizobium sp. BWA-3-5]|uniref:C1 family peptidase n=1 Tax=Bradyrhizobium sp. BWA-3-5 TaxID=3080013 RepID=UPI00293F2C78|nr:C1 family peptidase [Bradyrhizobium sp. BWA-3-5]WOH63693.1 C1 family peptidase [Bradyrhizobium sp. BWA-3-5]
MIKTIVDLRGSFGAARDQNPRPTCLAFAASDTHAALRPGWNPLSAEWAYYHAVKRDGGLPQDGSTLVSMLATIKCDGQPAESEWPYIQSATIDISSWLPPASPSELFFRDHAACGAALQDVVDQLDSSVPVLITMTLSDAFYIPEAGVVDRVEAIDPKRRHAVVAVGYGERAGKRAILIRNSWGEGWGLEGYAWLAEHYLAPRLTEVVILTKEL